MERRPPAGIAAREGSETAFRQPARSAHGSGAPASGRHRDPRGQRNRVPTTRPSAHGSGAPASGRHRGPRGQQNCVPTTRPKRARQWSAGLRPASPPQGAKLPSPLEPNRADAVGCGLALAFTSAVCRGELMALAEKRGWGAGKRQQIESVLNRFPTIGINQPSTVSAYSLIDAWARGASVQGPTNAPPPQPALPMSQNDLWVAATAHAGEAVLVSTDTDFHRLDGVWLKFVFVAQTRPV